MRIPLCDGCCCRCCCDLDFDGDKGDVDVKAIALKLRVCAFAAAMPLGSKLEILWANILAVDTVNKTQTEVYYCCIKDVLGDIVCARVPG